MRLELARVLLLSLLLVGSAIASDIVPPPQYMQARIMTEDYQQFEDLLKMNLDIVNYGPGFIEVVTTPVELQRFQDLGFATLTIHEDLSEFYKTRLAASKAPAAYKTLGQIESELFFLNLMYPAIFSPKISIGQTIEGRDIYAVKISDNYDVDEDEPEVLFTGTIHAREVITPEILFRFMYYLCENYGTDPVATDLVDNRELWFVVVINPDGYNYNDETNPGGTGLWRKNRRDNGDGTFGIDLNRNFGYMWGYDDIGSSPVTDDETYRGTGPFSEPEIQAIRDFIIAHDFVFTIFYHSYSNLIIWPYGYELNLTTPDQNIFLAVGEKLATYNNYTPLLASVMYTTNGGANDWCYGEQTVKSKSFSYTIECGGYEDGFCPDPGRIEPLTLENLPGNIYVSQIAADPYGILPPNTPVVTVPDSVAENVGYNVIWSAPDTANPPIQYELLERTGYTVVTDSANNFNNLQNNGFVLSSYMSHSSATSFHSGSPDVQFRYIKTLVPYLVLPNDSLKFWTYYEISQYWDYAWVEISTDNITYVTLPNNLTINQNYYYHNRGHGITGQSGGWIEAKFDISAYAGQQVYFRISYMDHNPLYSSWGIFIDDIRPVAAFQNTTVVSSSLTDTSYSIGGHVPGDYYYQVRAKDAENQWSVFSPMGIVTVAMPYFCGDANGDGPVNIKDVTFMINHLYKEAPAPVPAQAGDANGDGFLNIKDITYLINFLYKEGPDPICP